MSNKESGLSDKWFDQWKQTDSYLASDNHVNRIPLRLSSSNIVVYGSARLSEVLKEFEHEDHHPVTVGGKVPVQLWCNNFIATDCGPIDNLNPYIETWYSFPVTPKSIKLDLPYEDPYSYNLDNPETLTWCHRVLCGPAKDGYKLGAIAAIAGGREIWGFPKHPSLADLSFEYLDKETVAFAGSLQSNKVFSLQLKLPENIKEHLKVDIDVLTPKGACITPKQNPLRANFVAKQTRYQQAFSASMHFHPWDQKTDTLVVYDEEAYFGAMLKSWEFEPALKMHCSDLKIVAFKPDGWDPNFKG